MKSLSEQKWHLLYLEVMKFNTCLVFFTQEFISQIGEADVHIRQEKAEAQIKLF